ncbi:hypothetical protein Bca4012_074231 [Brassica carinata]
MQHYPSLSPSKLSASSPSVFQTPVPVMFLLYLMLFHNHLILRSLSFIILLSHEEHCTKYEATLSELWLCFMSIWVLNKSVFNKFFGTRSLKV